MSVSGRVVDFRVQPPFRSFLRMHFFRKNVRPDDVDERIPFGHDREPNPSMESGSLELFLEEMDAANIGRAVVVGQRSAEKWGIVSNEDIASLVKDYPDRFAGFAGIDPSDEDAEAQTRSAVEDSGLHGVALLPGWNDTPLLDDDDLVMPIYSLCVDLGVPVIVTSSHYIGADMNSAHPVHLQHVVETFPDLKLIVGHGSWPWTTAATALAMRYPNVYLMPEFYMYTPGMPGARDYVDAANTFLEDRILYSSCYPSRTLSEAQELFRSLPLTDSARDSAMVHNGRRLLGQDL